MNAAYHLLKACCLEGWQGDVLFKSIVCVSIRTPPFHFSSCVWNAHCVLDEQDIKCSPSDVLFMLSLPPSCTHTNTHRHTDTQKLSNTCRHKADVLNHNNLVCVPRCVCFFVKTRQCWPQLSQTLIIFRSLGHTLPDSANLRCQGWG